MVQLQLVSSTITEQELIRRAIPKLASLGGSAHGAHIGASLADVDAVFRRQFDKSATETLNELIKAGEVTLVFFEWSRKDAGYHYSRSRLRSVEILEATPDATPQGKKLRVYLSDNVPRTIRTAQKKFNKLKEILEEIKK